LCTTSLLLLAAGGVRLMRRVFPEPGFVFGVVLMTGLAVAQAVWTRLWAGGATGGAFFAWRTVELLGYALPAGLAAGVAGFAMCGWADRLSGLVRPVKEGHGILWAENNR
ncbi:MAG: hypothetical protein LBW77_00455, partial [Verrucomicrobiota bacterium]|nr:hypothetical protein [Verrucomicrobiota bacterium]